MKCHIPCGFFGFQKSYVPSEEPPQVFFRVLSSLTICTMKTRLHNLLAGIFFLSISAHAQNTFFKTYETSAGNTPNVLVAMDNGDMMLAGKASGIGHGGTDGFLSRLDGSGNVSWLKTFGATDDESLVSLVRTDASHFAALLEVQSASPKIYSLLLLDQSGVVQSSNSFTVSGLSFFLPGELVVLSNGRLLFPFAGGSDIGMICFESSGGLAWSNKITITNGGSLNLYGVAACALPGGGLAIVTTNSQAGPLMSEGYLLQCDDNGDVQSGQRISSTVDIACNRVTADLQTGAIYAAITANFSRFVVFKTGGGPDWTKVYNMTFMPHGDLRNFTRDPLDGSMTLLGGPGSGGIEIMHLDSTGNFLYSQSGLNFFQEPRAVAESPTGAVLFSGLTQSPSLYFNSFVCKLLEDGNRCFDASNTIPLPGSYTLTLSAANYSNGTGISVNNSSYTALVSSESFTPVITCATAVGIEVPDVPVEMTVSQNGDQLLLHASLPFSSGDRVSLFDLSGRKVLDQELSSGISRATLQLPALQSGLYLLGWIHDGAAYQQKIVIE